MSGRPPRLAHLRVVVCVGAGGVGKTTVAATLALGLAARGRKVALVTIDPARRLAEALGLDELGNDPQLVDPEPFTRAGLELPGELSAMMLDAKRTFDELVARLAPDRRTLDQILANRVYRHLSTAVAGSQDYSALAKLFEIERSGSYDVIVLDTPPSRTAVDFLLAPQRLRAFVDSRALSIFLKPTGAMLRVAGVVFGALRRIVGVAMLDDLTNFFGLMSGLTGGFRQRAADIQSLLASPSTGFVVVTAPDAGPVDEAIFLAAELERLEMEPSGVIVNRVHPADPAGSDIPATTARLAAELGDDLAAAVAREHAELQALAERELIAVKELTKHLSGWRTGQLLDRGQDVHDAPGLVALHNELFAPSEAAPRPSA